MSNSVNPIGNPPNAGKMNQTAKDAFGATDENGVSRYGTTPTGYLLKAMNSNSGIGSAAAEGANTSGIRV